MAQIHVLILLLNRFLMVILSSERGILLSGEMQRIGIARALYLASNILI